MENRNDEDITIDESDIIINEEALNTMRRRLEERNQIQRTRSWSSVCCIHKVPQSLAGINTLAVQPEIVSIGPYHRGEGNLVDFESYKWSFLDSLLHRTRTKGIDLNHFMKEMTELEASARRCYSEYILMSSTDFIQMMILDGCFIVELLQHISRNEYEVDLNDSPIFSTPWLIPIITRDLLKLENQLPFFVLESIHHLSNPLNGQYDPLPLLVLKFFGLAFPRQVNILKRSSLLDCKHLLDLFHLSFLPYMPPEPELYRPSSIQSIQCVAQLRSSGIEFKPKRADSFLEINFHRSLLRGGVLQIPSVTINDFTITVFINCVAIEQCNEFSPKHFSTYIAFMSCLINSTRDVTFLSADGIITSFSHNDQDVARLFGKLSNNIVFNIRDCHLSKQFGQVEAYYSSHWATLKRTYFSNPWTLLSVFSASLLLVLTGIQTYKVIFK